MKFMLAGSIVLLIGLFQASPCSAQSEEEYQDDLSPGLQLRGDRGGKSRLAEAARSGGSVVLSGEDSNQPAEQTAPIARTYVVLEGDTFWGICEKAFSDPYAWPQLWSYNPKVTNPHWIYPGDILQLSPEGSEGEIMAGFQPDPMTATPISRSSNVVLLRNRGFVDKQALEQSGTMIGSYKEAVLISQFDEAYVEFNENMTVRPGDEFAAYQILEKVEAADGSGEELGNAVEIYGLVRVSSFDKENRIARVSVDESIQPMERGILIGPVHRKFDLIPPMTNKDDIAGQVIAFLDPVTLVAAHQVVFVDKGAKDGVQEGNRLFVVEKRDRLRASHGEPDDNENFPEEVVGELRVIETRDHTSTCLVTNAIHSFEVGARFKMRKGY